MSEQDSEDPNLPTELYSILDIFQPQNVSLLLFS